jgi:hypothetical protein
MKGRRMMFVEEPPQNAITEGLSKLQLVANLVIAD